MGFIGYFYHVIVLVSFYRPCIFDIIFMGLKITHSCFICRYGNANVWKIFTDLFDYFPLTALVSMIRYHVSMEFQ